MKIVNPIYDIAFKYLMENNKLAKKVLSVILDKEIVELQLNQQETFVRDSIKGLKMFRMDFKATIKESDGSRKTVLIELQKSKNPVDIIRFRNYLASNYNSGWDEHDSEDTDAKIVADSEEEYTPYHPIIAVYILGYDLEDLPYLAVRVNREVTDAVSKQKINVKSFFIEHLTHEAHIIQVRRLPEKPCTVLEKLLLLFNQEWRSCNGFVINLREVPEEFADVAMYLCLPLRDQSFERTLFFEKELDIIYSKEAKHLEELADERQKSAKALKQKEKALKQKEKAHKEKEKALIEKKVLNMKLARAMKKLGASWQDIKAETGLTHEDIE